MELRTALNSAFGFELPATATFDFPTVQALARFVAQEKQEQLDAEPQAPLAAAAEEDEVEEVEEQQLEDEADYQQPQQFQTAAAAAVAVPAGPTRASVAAKIGVIVQRMLGAALEEDQTLMEAGLDSLGELAIREATGEQAGRGDAPAVYRTSLATSTSHSSLT